MLVGFSSYCILPSSPHVTELRSCGGTFEELYPRSAQRRNSLRHSAASLRLIAIEERYAMRAVDELSGPGLLYPRDGHSHVACRTTPVLNQGENMVTTHPVRPREQSLQQRLRFWLCAEQSLA